MKLLNRGPTEEMFQAGMDAYDSDVSTSFAIWQAMYDAATEIKVDVEPVAEIAYYEPDDGADDTDGEIYIHKSKGYEPKVGDKFYSTEQVAKLHHEANQGILDAANTALVERNALQAENERLKKECEYNFALYQDMGVTTHELAAERDDLQAQLAERDKTILEQQARIAALRDVLIQMKVIDYALEQDNLSALESALKAERIKTLEEVALKDANDGRYGYAESEIRRMVNELKDKS